MIEINKELLFGKFRCKECGEIYDNHADYILCEKEEVLETEQLEKLRKFHDEIRDKSNIEYIESISHLANNPFVYRQFKSTDIMGNNAYGESSSIIIDKGNNIYDVWYYDYIIGGGILSGWYNIPNKKITLFPSGIIKVVYK